MPSAPGARLWTAILFAAAPISLFVYNSGYGYDSLEYLLIGSALRDGVPFYTYVPSKSWALYGVLSVFLSIPAADGHIGRTVLVVGVLAMICLLTHRALASRFGAAAGIAAAGLIGACALFAELNYIQPEPFVYVAGLMAFRALTPVDAWSRRGPWAAAGLWLGAGMAFKSVAAFYLVGFAVWVLVERALDASRPAAMPLAVLAAGFVAALMPPAVYFALTDRWQPYVEWSYAFPLFNYPPHVEWLPKLLVKMGWVWLLIAASFALSLQASMRRLVFGDRHVRLLGLAGITALLPLLKTQASHYAFPGAAFLLLCCVIVWHRLAEKDAIAARAPGRVRLAAAGLALLCVVSGVLYRPSAAARLWTVRSFAEERTVADAINRLADGDERVIFLTSGTRLYWLSRRLPNWPVVNTDVQTTYLVQRGAGALLQALDDSRLVLVEYDPGAPLDDTRFRDTPDARAFLDSFAERLDRSFDRRADILPPLVLWTRKPADARPACRLCPPAA